MPLARKFSTQAFLLGFTGALVGYGLGPYLPSSTAADLVQALGNVTAIAGSILGFSVSWLSQSRALIKDVDYDAAGEIFTSLGQLQHELLWRWGIALACSIGVVVGAVVLKAPHLETGLFRQALAASTGLLATALGFVTILFFEMLSISRLKNRLDEHERAELRKLRNIPSAK